MTLQVKLYTYCSINKQYVEGEQKWQKALSSVATIATWLYYFLARSETISLLFKEQKQKDIKKRFLDCHVTLDKTPTL